MKVIEKNKGKELVVNLLNKKEYKFERVDKFVCLEVVIVEDGKETYKLNQR